MSTTTTTTLTQPTQTLPTFPTIPPFPTDLPTAPLLTISLSSLLSNSSSESLKFFEACKDLGFFYLDLRDDELGRALLGEAEELFGLSKGLFELGREVLDEFDYSGVGSYIGYKGFGKGVVDRKGTSDRNEFFNSSKDDFLGQSQEPLSYPQILHDHTALLQSYMKNAHSVIDIILSHLNTHLQLPPHTLQDLHSIKRISGDHIRMIEAPPQDAVDRGASMGAHTDFGSVTLLVNKIGGLQVLLPNSKSFVHVRPVPGHCIINLGDAMVKFSNGLLRSNVHRVISPPGEQAGETRYSLVYFSRPGDEVLLKRLEGGAIPPLAEGAFEEDVKSVDWIRDKALARRKGAEKFVGVTGQGRETAEFGDAEDDS